MTSEEIFSYFIKETIGYPYFSTLYDMDMWEEDKERIENDLEVLDILKKHFFEEYKIRSGTNSLLFRINCTPEYEKVKKWLEGGRK